VDVITFVLEEKRECLDMVKANYKALVFVK
jgi:hypothetical protein